MRAATAASKASTVSSTGRRIVFTTLGSLGDLYPYLALALGMRARGYQVILATSSCYQQRVEVTGVPFLPLRPDSDWVADPDHMARYMHPRWGTFRVLREQVLPALRQSYEDTWAAADGADLLVSHPIAYATRLVAEKRGMRWASSLPFPLGIFSAHDPPLVPGAPPGLSQALRALGPAFWEPLSRLLRRATRSWAAPWYALRREIGLPAAPDRNPLVDGHSPDLHLALFSKLLADQQTDWPVQTILTGFPFYDQDGEEGRLSPSLERFLDAGEPPVVFTLGWSAAAVAGSFFACSIDAARRLGCRAVFVVGRPSGNESTALPTGMMALAYAPFSSLFPRAAAVVHAGGVGTTALAMRAGRPTLIVPFAQDQFDNAARAARRGLACALGRRDYTPARVAAELGHLLGDPVYARRAQAVREKILQEDGVRVACDALEALL